MDARANHLQSSINTITGQIAGIGDQLNVMMSYVMQQQPAATAAEPSQVNSSSSASSSSSSVPVDVKDEADVTPFQRGVRFQSNVGVNRDHTPHPVVAKIQQGFTSSNPTAPLPSISPASDRPIRPARSDDVDVDDDDDDKVWKDVKPPLPQAFRGQLTTDSLALRGFIQRMERYMQFKQIRMSGRRSLDFAVTLLDGVASQWYEGIKHDASINCWHKLKAAMIRRFEPDDVEEKETMALVRTDFKTNVTAFNHEFTTHQQLAADGFRNNDEVLIYLYRIALDRAPGTSWLCTMLKAKIDSENLTTLSQVMNAALRLEATLKQGRKSNGAATVAVSSSSYRSAHSSSSSPSHHNGGSSSRFQRSTPVRNPQFNTPVRVNNIAAGDGGDDPIDDPFDHPDSISESPGDNRVGDVDQSFDGYTNGDGSSSSTGAAGAGADDDPQTLVLNAMKAQQKFGQRYGMTPEELLRCRQNGLCFKCKKPGHMSSACPSGGNQSSKKL